MYRVTRPIRVAQKDEHIFIISVSRIGIRAEINENVMQFLQYLVSLNQFDICDIKAYVDDNNITNGDEFNELFLEMRSTGIIEEI